MRLIARQARSTRGDVARSISGRTIPCISDGDCPDGALCDDKLMLIDVSGQNQGVCKPGPRGSLAMTPLVPS